MTPLYKHDSMHWVYFGWENDHPKSLSFMGGGLVPRRGLAKDEDEKNWAHTPEPHAAVHPGPILYGLVIDGQSYGPDEHSPDRRKNTRWSLAEGYLPSPVSEWDAGSVGVRIQHFANRVLDDSATAIYTRVSLTNNGSAPRKLSLVAAGNGMPERQFVLGRAKPSRTDETALSFDVRLAAGASRHFDFVAPATGNATPEQLLAAGSFLANYKSMRRFYDKRIARLTYPTSLPGELTEMYKSTMCAMWITIVKVPGDYEMRASGGNPGVMYQYDRTFSHDIPNMVVQFIKEGDYETARNIMEGATYQRLGHELQHNYLDAIPKYIVPYAAYLQLSGDKAYFTEERRRLLRENSRRIHEHRKNQLDDSHKESGTYGIMDKSNTLDNKEHYLVVDNFAALHGLAAYAYIADTLKLPAEAEWARTEMKDINDCLNAALDFCMKRRDVDWYMSTFNDLKFWEIGYDGNWFGTTMMMSTFPWSASLRGFDLGGTWKDHFDATIDNCLEMRKTCDKGIPEHSWGAWWDHEYGPNYNAGMGLQTLISDKHRTMTADNLEWLLKTQTAPMQWGESFDKGQNDDDWTTAAMSYETWGLGFIRQALLEMCASPKTDGTLIIGRGIPNRWLADGQCVAWKNVLVGRKRKLDLSIRTDGNAVLLEIQGGKPLGDIVFDLPGFVGNIDTVQVDGEDVSTFDEETGQVRLPGTMRLARVTCRRPLQF